MATPFYLVMFEKDDLIRLKKNVYHIGLKNLILNHCNTIGKIIGIKTFNSYEFYLIKFACYKRISVFYKPIIDRCFEKINDNKSYNIY